MKMQSPPTVRAAAAVQAAEAAVVCAASALSAADAAAGLSYQAGSGIALTLIGLVAAGLARARRWSRTPALLTQLFTGIVGIYLVEGHQYGWGVPVLVLAAAGFVMLLVPPSLRALTSGRPAPPAGPPGGRAG